MKFKNFVLFSVFIVILCVFLLGCELLGITQGDDEEEGVDLSIDSVEPLTSGTEVDGIRLVFRNDGNTEVDAEYALVFSVDTTISIANDTEIFVGNVRIGAGATKQVDLSGETEIGPYIENNSVTIEDGDYYIGAIIDPNDAVTEWDETNNEGVSQDIFPFYMSSTLFVEVSNGSYIPDYTMGYFAVFEHNTDPQFDDPIAEGEMEFIDGYAAATAFDYNNPDEDWNGQAGYSYQFFLLVDMNGNIETTMEPDLGDYTNIEDSITLDNQETVFTIDAATELQIVGSKVTVEVINADFVPDGTNAYYGIFENGASPETDTPLAFGEFIVQGGFGDAMSLDYNNQSVDWLGEAETDYDLYFFLDMNNNYADVNYPDEGDVTNIHATFHTDWGETLVTLDWYEDLQYSGDVLAVEVFNADNGVTHDAEGRMTYFVVVPSEGDPTTDVVAEGNYEITSGYGIGLAYDTSTDKVWVQNDGMTYDVYVFVDMNSSGSSGPDSGDLTVNRSIDMNGGYKQISFNMDDAFSVYP
ncbi:MAG: hypothetical protein ACLFR1_14155 [Spirochaetia bacterium]